MDMAAYLEVQTLQDACCEVRSARGHLRVHLASYDLRTVDAQL